jgi:hypothetical protein
LGMVGTPVTPAFGRCLWEDGMFEASLGYVVTPCKEDISGKQHYRGFHKNTTPRRQHSPCLYQGLQGRHTGLLRRHLHISRHSTPLTKAKPTLQKSSAPGSLASGPQVHQASKHSTTELHPSPGLASTTVGSTHSMPATPPSH